MGLLIEIFCLRAYGQPTRFVTRRSNLTGKKHKIFYLFCRRPVFLGRVQLAQTKQLILAETVTESTTFQLKHQRSFSNYNFVSFGVIKFFVNHERFLISISLISKRNLEYRRLGIVFVVRVSYVFNCYSVEVNESRTPPLLIHTRLLFTKS